MPNPINPRTGKPYQYSYSQYIKIKQAEELRAKKEKLQKVTGSVSPRRAPINKQQAKKATVQFDKINREPYN